MLARPQARVARTRTRVSHARLFCSLRRDLIAGLLTHAANPLLNSVSACMQIHGSHVPDHAQVPQSGHALVIYLGGSSLLGRRRPSSSWSCCCTAGPACGASCASSSFSEHRTWRFGFGFVFCSRRSFEIGSAVIILEVARTDVVSNSRHPRFFCLVVLDPSASPPCRSRRATRIIVIVVAAPSCELCLRHTTIARNGTSPSPKQYSLRRRPLGSQVSHAHCQWVNYHFLLVAIGIADRSAPADDDGTDTKGDDNGLARWAAEFGELDGWRRKYYY